MASVGIRELKEHTSEILRRVDDGESIEITRRGKVFAKLVPTENRRSEEGIRRFGERMAELRAAIAEDIGDTPVDAVALAREQRRNFIPDEGVPSNSHSDS